MRSTTLGGGRDVGDHVDALARDHGGGVEIARVARLVVARGLVRLMLHQLGLAAAPFLGEFVAQHAACIRRGPHVLARDVEQDAADGLVAARRHDALLGGLQRRTTPAWRRSACRPARRPRRASAPPQARARPRRRPPPRPARRAPHPPPPAPARRCRARCRGRRLPRPAPRSCRRRSATASFACSTVWIWQIISAPACLDLVRVRLHVAERQHDRGRLSLQRDVQEARVLRHAPGDEADADARVARGGRVRAPATPRCRSRRR